MPVVTSETIVLVQIRCPYNAKHVLPVRVPQGTRYVGYCRSCGREFERVA